MSEKFDILEYLSGLTGFVFDKAVLKRIALDRDVFYVRDYSELSTKAKELCKADLLYTVLLMLRSPARSTHSHGSFSQTIGQQIISDANKENIRNQILGIYKKYDDAMLEEAENADSNLQWLDC